LGVVCGLAEELDPACSLLFSKLPAEVPGDHPVVSAIALGVQLRTAEHLA
jgi:hypothetical protein